MLCAQFFFQDHASRLNLPPEHNSILFPHVLKALGPRVKSSCNSNWRDLSFKDVSVALAKVTEWHIISSRFTCAQSDLELYLPAVTNLSNVP